MSFFKRRAAAVSSNPLASFKAEVRGDLDFVFKVEVGEVSLSWWSPGTPERYPALYQRDVHITLRSAWSTAAVVSEVKVLFEKNQYGEIYRDRARDLLHRDLRVWRVLADFNMLTPIEKAEVESALLSNLGVMKSRWEAFRGDLVNFAREAQDTTVGGMLVALREVENADHQELDKAYEEYRAVYLKTYHRDALELL